MKIKFTIIFSLIGLFLSTCGQGQIKIPKDAMNKFDKFLMKEKFVENDMLFYPGIGDSAMLTTLTEKINLAAQDFKKLAENGVATDKEYQNLIEIGLQRFADNYLDLDTEDRERVCTYFEELMDIVGLESSNGLLNNFMYGFDPTK